MLSTEAFWKLRMLHGWLLTAFTQCLREALLEGFTARLQDSPRSFE